jgi:hypothetical protein
MGFQLRRSMATLMAVATSAVVVVSNACSVAQEATAPAVDLPDGKAVYEQHLEATGGQERFANFKTSRMVGTIELSEMQGMKAPMIISRERPNKLAVKISFEGIGDVHQGSNGEIAWDVAPMQGARVLSGTEKDERMKQADFDEEFNVDKYYKTIECTSEEEVDGKKCYVVEFTDNNDEVEKRFFDDDSHLLVKIETKRNTPLGKLDVVSKLSDYREIDGVKMPFRNEVSVMGNTRVITFEEVAFNVEHDAGTFDPPEDVVKILEKKKEKAAKTDEES